MLFPDQIVVLGRRPLFVPYVDPGLALARRVRDALGRPHGEPPKVIYLGNHGLFALGRTPEHVLQITAMAVKASRCSRARSPRGARAPLTEADADRIDTRPDEHYRRAALARDERRDDEPERSGRQGRGGHRCEHRHRARGGAGAIDHGARVVIAARSRERLDEAAAALGPSLRRGGRGRHARRRRARLVDGTLESHGRIDILVANAGVYVGGDLWESDPEALDRLLTTNVNGVVRTVREVLPHLLEQGEGDILVTSSVAGHQAIHWEPVYSASKHALQAFVHTMRRQLIGTGCAWARSPPASCSTTCGASRTRPRSRTKVARGEGIRSEDVADAVALHAHAPAPRYDPRPRHPPARPADLSRRCLRTRSTIGSGGTRSTTASRPRCTRYATRSARRACASCTSTARTASTSGAR